MLSPKSGIATTRAAVPASWRAASRLVPLMLSTSSAPASTAVRISSGSKLSTLSRRPAPRSSRTTSPSAGKGTPGVQPMSIRSAPLARKYVGRRLDGLPGQLGGVVDLGEDLDVVGAVLHARPRPTEVAGNLPQVLGALLDRHAVPLAEDFGLALDRPGSSTRSVSAGTSRKRAIHGVVISAATVIFMTATTASNGGAISSSTRRSAGSASRPVTNRTLRGVAPGATVGPPAGPTCSACPPARRRSGARERPPRSCARARSPCR